MNRFTAILIGILVCYITYFITLIYCSIGETQPGYTVTWQFLIIMLVITISPAVLGYLIGIEVAKE